MGKKIHYIYMLECCNGAYYTGYTTDLARRYQEHVQGLAKCKYTRSFPPLRMAMSWELLCERSDVLKIENVIKRLTKKAKQALIDDPASLMTQLAKKGFNGSI